MVYLQKSSSDCPWMHLLTGFRCGPRGMSSLVHLHVCLQCNSLCLSKHSSLTITCPCISSVCLILEMIAMHSKWQAIGILSFLFSSLSLFPSFLIYFYVLLWARVSHESERKRERSQNTTLLYAVLGFELGVQDTPSPMLYQLRDFSRN